MFINLRQLISACSIGSLLLPTVCGVQLHAGPEPDARIPPPLHITAAAGTVTDFNKTNSACLVINIQDLHGQAEVQRNIARILADIEKQFPLATVYVEGGCGQVDTSWLCDIGDEDLRTDIIEALVDQGLLTGGEYYSVLSKRPLLLRGIEDGRVHRENVARLGALIARQPLLDKKLADLRADLTLMKRRHFSRQSRRFDAIAAQYRSGALPPETYYSRLAAYAAKLNRQRGPATNPGALDMAQYPNITGFCAAGRAARRVNHAKALREFARFTNVLKKAVPFAEYQSFLNDARTRQDWRLLAERSMALASRYHIALGRFPYLQEFFSWAALNARVNPVQLVHEQIALERHIREALAQGSAESDVAFLAEFFPVFEDFLQRRISSEQYAYATEHLPAFQAAWAAYARFTRTADLNEDYDMAAAFHAANIQRNALFLKHIPARTGKVPAAAGRDEDGAAQKPTAIVMITGGFHGSGLKSLLRERGLSYMIITPSITTESASAARRYAARAVQQAASIPGQAMQLALASQAAAEDQFSFCLSAAHKYLREVPFTRANIDKLIAQLKYLLGNEQVALGVDEARETATIVFSDGRKSITLTRNAFTDAMVPAGAFTRETAAAAVQTAVLKNLAEVLRNEVVASEALVGLMPMISGTSAVFDRVAAFAARHNLAYGNGYTRELRNDDQLRSYVNERLGMVAALLPPSAQDMAAARARRELRIEAGSRDGLMQAVLAVDILHDFLLSINAARSKPVPVLLDTTIGWADFRQEDMVRVPDCPVCGSHHNEPVGMVIINGKPLELGQCRECTMIWYRTRPPVSFYEGLYGPEYFGYDGQGFEPHGQTDTTINVGIRKHPQIADIARREIDLWKRFLPASANANAPMQGLHIVEVGPGGGHLLIEGKHQGAAVFGVDISQFIVDRLRGNGIAGAVGQLQDAGIPPSSVDGLAAYDLVEHVLDLDLFLDTAFDMLKPGGFLFIRTPDTNGNTPLLHLIDHILHFSQATLTEALQRHGFTVVYAQPSGPFEGPDGKMIDNMTVFAKKSDGGRPPVRSGLSQNGSPAPDPLTRGARLVPALTEAVPDAEALEAILSSS